VEAAAGARFAYGRQVHGNVVRRVRDPTGEPAEHDGLVTEEAGVAPMVLVADCLPIVVAGGGAVAVLHGGWRGLAGGIIDRGVGELRAFAGPTAELAAAIGPGAGPCCYGSRTTSTPRSSAWARRCAGDGTST
jgi:copper oxidase (laccase) domain-containing protein